MKILCNAQDCRFNIPDADKNNSYHHKIKLLSQLNKLWDKIEEVKMRNWKTTLSGVLSALGPVLLALGMPKEVAAAVTTVGLFLLGYFAKDFSITGTGR